MGEFMNEDVMWERLKDIQREVENAHLYRADRGPNPLRRLVDAVGVVWSSARRHAPIVDDEADATRRVA